MGFLVKDVENMSKEYKFLYLMIFMSIVYGTTYLLPIS